MKVKAVQSGIYQYEFKYVEQITKSRFFKTCAQTLLLTRSTGNNIKAKQAVIYLTIFLRHWPTNELQ